MRVTIQFLGQARQLARADRLEIDLPDGACANETLPAILDGADPRLATVLAEEGKLRSSVMAILREETIDPDQRNLLADGDELSLLPPMSGG